MDADPHVEEFKVRLTETDADLFRALAKKKGIPPAVLMRAMVLEAMGPAVTSVPNRTENRRPA